MLRRIALDTMVTVVDAHTFIQDYSSRNPIMARPDLGEGGALRPVVDLLVEQIECDTLRMTSNAFSQNAVIETQSAPISPSVMSFADAAPNCTLQVR